MRTTGLRIAPIPAPRKSNDENSSSFTIPETESIPGQSDNVTIDETQRITLQVISQSIPPREGLAKELAKVTESLSISSETGFVTPVSTPPPKPPRIYTHELTSKAEEEETPEKSLQPPPITPTALSQLKKLDRKASTKGSGSGAVSRAVISSPDTISPSADHNSFITTPPSSIVPHSASTPSGIITNPGTAGIRKSQMAWRSLRRRILAEDIPPPPSASPPTTPSTPNNSLYPPLPVDSDHTTAANANSPIRPVAARPTRIQPSVQLNGNARGPSQPARPPSSVTLPPSTRPRQRPSSQVGPLGESGGHERSRPRAVSYQAPSPSNPVLDQAPIATVPEFEGTCKQIFRLQRNAKSLMDQNQYNKAVAKYQMALGFIDKVLKTRVLEITTHEPTRQSFFQMQEAVFSIRKECLNGFSDAQAAVDIPQELSTTNPPPGAPPSYQDVLREDRRRTRGPPPPVPVRPTAVSRSTSNSQGSPVLIQSQVRWPPQPQPQVSPRRQPQAQPISQPVAQAQRLPELSSSSQSNTNTRLQEQSPLPQDQTKPQPRNLQLQTKQQPNDQVSAANAPVHPRPLPRTRLKPQPKPRTETQIQTEPEIQQQTNSQSPKHQSSEQLQVDTQSITQYHAQDQPQRRPVYLRNQAQPIGDLISQVSSRRLHPVVRHQRSISLISDGNDINIPTQSSMEPPCESAAQKEISDTLRFKPRTPVQMSVPRPKSQYHQDKTVQPSSESLYDVPRRQVDTSTVSEMGPKYISNTQHFKARPPKPLRRNILSQQKSKDKIDELQTTKGMKNSTELSTNDIYINQIPRRGVSGTMQADVVNDGNSSSSHNSCHASCVPDSPGKTIIDPFATLDPFPPITPCSIQSDISFSENITGILTPGGGLDVTDGSNSSSSVKSHMKSVPLPTPIKPIHALELILQPSQASAIESKIEDENESAMPPKNTSDITTDQLGDSILDALDFAVVSNHLKVSPQVSKEIKYSRCRSEETLLDYSYNTLGKYLESANSSGNNRMARSTGRISIIDEFDPLVLLSPIASDNELDEEEVALFPAVAETGSNSTLTPNDDEAAADSYYAVPRKLKWKSENNTNGQSKNTYQEEVKDKKIIEDSEHLYENATPEPSEDPCDMDNYVTSPYHIYAEVGTRSSVASSSGSTTSWPTEVKKFNPSSPTPTTPSTAGISDQDSCGPWNSTVEESEDDYAEDVGRSAFYRAVSSDQSSTGGEMSPPPVPEGAPGKNSSSSSSSSSYSTNTLRELLKIREGVKIYFIHVDGVVTCPWNRPFLSVAKDSSNSLPGQNLLLRVGKSLWSCELVSKATLVFKSEGSTYVFKETNDKPECAAVAIRVPSSVRKVQHELLSRIMRDHTRLEEERPSGMTKSVSKGAASAATRVNKIVEGNETHVNQAFVRRNSMRALKGVSKRLNSLAQKTGSTLPELPQDYNCLQDAANTLRFSRSAKTVQYI